MEKIFWLCVVATFYAYFGYPLILAAANRLRTTRRVDGNVAPRDDAQSAESPVGGSLGRHRSVTVVITARNEEQVIRTKLENTLRLTLGGVPIDSLMTAAAKAGEGGSSATHHFIEVLVASDASEDGTDDVVRSFASRGVELVRLDVRGGKERAQIEAVNRARGEILVFTDAKIRLEPDALEAFVKVFDEPAVGIVSSVDRVESGPTGGSGEGMYVRYEMWLRALESSFLSLVGVSGSCFAVRREICSDLRPDIPSDFALLLAARRRKLRGVHAPQVVASYRAVATEEAEFERKVRTVLRGITTLFACKEILNPLRFGIFSWQVWSHKVMRWLVPLWILLGTAAAFVLANGSYLYSAVAALLVVFYLAAVLALYDDQMRNRIWCKLPLFFLIVNAAIGVAWMMYFKGQRTVAWNPSAKGA